MMPLEMVNVMTQHTGRTRLMALRVMIDQKDISDQSIPAFLSTAQQNLRNPYTGEPMRWSSEHRVIWFDAPEGASTAIPLQVRLAGGRWREK